MLKRALTVIASLVFAAVAVAQSPKPSASPKGIASGITVHGHWVLEVKSKTGKVVRHVEFENSLDPGFSAFVDVFQTFGSGPGTGPSAFSGGSSVLAQILTGGSQIGPGSWAVLLMPPASIPSTGLGGPPEKGIGLNLDSTASAACSLNAPSPGLPTIWSACMLASPNSQGFEGISQGCGNSASVAGLSCNLSVAHSGGGVVLQGTSAAVAQAGQIGAVATLLQPTGSSTFNSFTSSTNFPGAPIAVAQGQTVAVTVTITFH